MSELRQTLLWGQTSIDRVRSFLHFADFKCPERRRCERRCPARYPGSRPLGRSLLTLGNCGARTIIMC